MITLHITTDKSDLDIDLIHAFLANESSWARESRARSSSDPSSIRCASAVSSTDGEVASPASSGSSTFANLVDVFVLPAHRGKGYSKRLMEAVMSHADLQGLQAVHAGDRRCACASTRHSDSRRR